MPIPCSNDVPLPVPCVFAARGGWNHLTALEFTDVLAHLREDLSQAFGMNRRDTVMPWNSRWDTEQKNAHEKKLTQNKDAQITETYMIFMIFEHVHWSVQKMCHDSNEILIMYIRIYSILFNIVRFIMYDTHPSKLARSDYCNIVCWNSVAWKSPRALIRTHMITRKHNCIHLHAHMLAFFCGIRLFFNGVSSSSWWFSEKLRETNCQAAQCPDSLGWKMQRLLAAPVPSWWAERYLATVKNIVFHPFRRKVGVDPHQKMLEVGFNTQWPSKKCTSSGSCTLPSPL